VPLHRPTFNPSQQHAISATDLSNTRFLGQQPRHASTRPPVPLCNQKRTNMAGTTPHRSHLSRCRSNPARADSFFDELTTGVGGDLSATDGGLPDFDWDLSAASNFTTINGHPASTSTQTISPKDLFNESPAAPASTAFTNLTSPDINESPFLGGTDSYQTSPAFLTEGDFHTTDDHWYSLFPDSTNETPASADPIQRTISDHSIQTSSSGGSPAIGTAAQRKSLTDTPPPGRHSSVSGVKPRRRKGPLPEIPLDPGGDKTTYKRARNTLAARESRQRKLAHVTDLEGKISELEADLEKYKTIATSLGYVE
jgi:general control protein GCN4